MSTDPSKRPGQAAGVPADIRRVTAADATVDAAAVGDVLATALTDSPLQVLLAGDRNTRKAALRRGLVTLAGWATVHAAVYLRSDGAGAAIWLPAGPPTPRPPDRLGAEPVADDGQTPDHAVDAALLELGAETPNSAGLETLATLLLPSRVAGNALAPAYLIAVGVDPDARGHGIAQQLLDVHHRQLDELHATAHAVAVDLAGHRLLDATGYRPDHVDQVNPRLALQWMQRPPRSGGDAAW